MNSLPIDAVLTGPQRERAAGFRAFAQERVAPMAREWDRQERIPDDVLSAMGAEGYFGATVPEAHGGRGWDAVTFGLLHEAIGRHDSALAGYLTIQAMVAMPLLKWGTAEQRSRWLTPLARGEALGSIALTEPHGGSDLARMQTELVPDGGGYRLRGEKKWVSGSQRSDVFLVFASWDGPGRGVACLVPRGAPGFQIEPINDLVGFRAAGLGRLRFDDVPVGSAEVVGRPGFGFTHVAPLGLHYGRISTACSALGLLRGCVEESASFAAHRQVGGRPAAELGMLQTLLARMATDARAAAWLCWSACAAADRRAPEAYAEAFAAKYFSSRAAVRASADAVQIHGAAGLHESSPVARFFRSSKVMEIIEGTTQVHEAVLAADLVAHSGRG